MLQTDRLILEPWDHDAHGEAFAVINADPEVMRYLGGADPMPRAESDAMSRRVAAHWETYGFGLWAARRRDTGSMIGFAGLSHPLWWPAMIERVEVGWRLARDAWGSGFATEGGRAALRYGFQTLGLEEIVAFVHPDNERSLAVTRRLGMDEEAEVPHPSRDDLVKVLRCTTW
jgi:RimJ/RimL family protein N-acetyltransferase